MKHLVHTQWRMIMVLLPHLCWTHPFAQSTRLYYTAPRHDYYNRGAVRIRSLLSSTRAHIADNLLSSSPPTTNGPRHITFMALLLPPNPLNLTQGYSTNEFFNLSALRWSSIETTYFSERNIMSPNHMSSVFGICISFKFTKTDCSEMMTLYEIWHNSF